MAKRQLASEQSQDWISAAKANLDLGQASQIKGDFLRANTLFIKAGELNIRNADSLNDGVYINIATTFINLHDTGQEHKYLRQAQ